MPNTPPTLTGLAPTATFNENAVNAAPALIDADVSFSDPDQNFTGAKLIMSGLLTEDQVAIRNQGYGAGQIGIFGNNVTYTASPSVHSQAAPARP